MKLFFSSLSSSRKYKNIYMATALNGDLSPTALDQLQMFGTDIFRVGTTAYIYLIANGQGSGDSSIGDIDLGFVMTKDLTVGKIYEGWTRYRVGNPNGDAQPVLVNGAVGEWDHQQVLSRTTFFDEDAGIYKMWYCAAKPSAYKVGYQTSLDGFVWTKHPSNPIYESTQFPPLGVITFAVHKDNPTSYHAIASGEGNTTTNGSLYVISTDGINWTEQGSKILIGTGIRSVKALTKEGDDYILTCGEGSNLAHSGNYGGIQTITSFWKTQDFVNFEKIHDFLEKVEPAEAGLSGQSWLEYGGKYYTPFMYYKNQWKAFNQSGAPEGFTAVRICESNVSPIDINQPVQTVVYPPYVLRYYPLADGEIADTTQHPLERLRQDAPITTGTLAWNERLYVQFNGSQKMVYPSYVEQNLTDFSVKANVYPYKTGELLIAKQDGVWELLNETGKLGVKLYDSLGGLVKHYTTLDDIVKPVGVWDEEEEVKVGFMFNSGVLTLGFGDGFPKGVTKTLDNNLTEISLKNDVQIGEIGETNSIRSLVLMTNPTEYQWVYEIDF